jgi:hypothetical protein
MSKAIFYCQDYWRVEGWPAMIPEQCGYVCPMAGSMFRTLEGFAYPANLHGCFHYNSTGMRAFLT